MKGVILAGGTGSRLSPLTKVTNKCLLPVGNTPMVYRMLDLFTGAGIHEVMLVTGPEHMGQVISLLGSGADNNCELTYKVQDKANGIAAALKLCRNFCGNDRFAVVLGDNIFDDNATLSKQLQEFGNSSDDFLLFGKVVPDPERFGVPVYSNGRVVDIVEKPKVPPSDQAIVGLYCYTQNVFDFIDSLKPSARGEYEISDVNSWLVKNGVGKVIDVAGGWIDAGTHESYRKANEMVWSKSR